MIYKSLNKLVLVAIFAAQVFLPAQSLAQEVGGSSLFGKQGISQPQPIGVMSKFGGETKSGTFDSSLPVRPTIVQQTAPEELGFFETLNAMRRSFEEALSVFSGSNSEPAEEEVLGLHRATITNIQGRELSETTVEFSTGAVIDEDSIQAPQRTTVIVVGNIIFISHLPAGSSVSVDIRDPGTATFESGGVTGPVKLIKPEAVKAVRKDFTEAVHDARLSDEYVSYSDRELPNLIERLSRLNCKELPELKKLVNDFLAELSEIAAGLASEFDSLADQFGKFADAYDKVSKGLGEGDGKPVDWKAVDEALAKAEQFFKDAAEWTQTKSEPGPLTNAVGELVNTIQDLRNADDSGYAKDAEDFEKAVDSLKTALDEFGSAETKAADAETSAAWSKLADSLKRLGGADCPLPTVVSGFPGEITDRGGTVVGQKEDLTGTKGDFDELAGKVKQLGGGDRSITRAIEGPGEEIFDIKETVDEGGKIIFVEIKYYANQADKAAGKPLAKGFGSEKEGARTDEPNERERLGQFGGVGYRIRMDGYWKPGSEGAIELLLNKFEKALRKKLAGLLGDLVDTAPEDNDALPTIVIDSIKARQKPCTFDDFKNKFGFDVGDLKNDPDKTEEIISNSNGVQRAMLRGLVGFRSEPIDPKVAAARDALVDYLIVAVTTCNFDFSLIDKFTGVTSAGAVSTFVGISEDLEKLGRVLEIAEVGWNEGDWDGVSDDVVEALGEFDDKARKAVDAFINMLKSSGDLTDYNSIRDKVMIERITRGF